MQFFWDSLTGTLVMVLYKKYIGSSVWKRIHFKVLPNICIVIVLCVLVAYRGISWLNVTFLCKIVICDIGGIRLDLFFNDYIHIESYLAPDYAWESSISSCIMDGFHFSSFMCLFLEGYVEVYVPWYRESSTWPFGLHSKEGRRMILSLSDVFS